MHGPISTCITATRAGLEKHWKVSKRNRVPCSFVFFKNKTCEWEGEWKMRLLFSYCTHPIKRYSSTMGWALTLLVKEARRLLKAPSLFRI